MEDLLSEVERYVKVRVSTYLTMMPHLAEDAIQEARIQAWRDVEAGVAPKLKILRRAALATERFFQSKGETPFGKPHQSRDGIVSHSETLEKVQVFVKEYLPVHNKYPSGKETAKALGITSSSACVALKRIREGRVDHGVYWVSDNGDRHRDRDYYTTSSIENFVSRDSLNGNHHWSESPELARFQTESFEDGVDTRVYLDKYLSQLPDRQRQVLEWYLFEQYNTGDIGRALGYTRTPSQHGTKALKGAVSQLQLRMNPYEGDCKKGHKRTPANTRFVDTEGILKRFCKVCDRKM